MDALTFILCTPSQVKGLNIIFYVRIALKEVYIQNMVIIKKYLLQKQLICIFDFVKTDFVFNTNIPVLHDDDYMQRGEICQRILLDLKLTLYIMFNR